MARKQLEARIIITRGQRPDCKVEISVYDVQNDKFTDFKIPAGPRQQDIDREVYRLKGDLERAGNYVTFCERSAV